MPTLIPVDADALRSCAVAFITGALLFAGTPATADEDPVELSEELQTAPAVSDARLKDMWPDPALQAGEVVRLQMQALGANARLGNDDGIAVAFRFASPANRQMTGPIDRFTALVKNPLYAPMLDFVEIKYAPARESGPRAMIPVLVTARDGSRAGYMFTLGLQRDEPCECWMTESVSRVDLGDAGERRGPAI